MDFYDLDFVDLEGVTGVSPSGVACWDFVDWRCSCSNDFVGPHPKLSEPPTPMANKRNYTNIPSWDAVHMQAFRCFLEILFPMLFIRSCCGVTLTAHRNEKMGHMHLQALGPTEESLRHQTCLLVAPPTLASRSQLRPSFRFIFLLAWSSMVVGPSPLVFQRVPTLVCAAQPAPKMRQFAALWHGRGSGTKVWRVQSKQLWKLQLLMLRNGSPSVHVLARQMTNAKLIHTGFRGKWFCHSDGLLGACGVCSRFVTCVRQVALIHVGLQMFTVMDIGCEGDPFMFVHFCSKTNRSRISYWEWGSLA